MSSVRKLCRMCGKLAANTCKLCGKSVCDDHYDKKSGLCTDCMHGRKA